MMGDKGGEKQVDAKIIKKTQDTLGRIVKKPPLTDKLLQKPPFRFLHDIVTSVSIWFFFRFELTSWQSIDFGVIYFGVSKLINSYTLYQLLLLLLHQFTDDNWLVNHTTQFSNQWLVHWQQPRKP